MVPLRIIGAALLSQTTGDALVPGTWHAPCPALPMDRLDRFLGIHATALRLRSERMGILASNIANAATPGFKARDLDFAALIAPKAPALPLAATQAGHIANPAGSEPSERVRYRVPIQPSLDGNTVELATEQVQFAETALRYRSSLSFLNGRLAALSTALKVE